MALLAKWRWRLLIGDEGLWVRVLRSRYGNVSVSHFEGESFRGRKASIWWKNLIQSRCSNSTLDWFKEGLVRRVGRGKNTKFWEDSWIGDLTLKEAFPRLYMLSVQKKGFIESFGEWNNDKWEWILTWRRALYAWEKDLLDELHRRLHKVVYNRGYHLECCGVDDMVGKKQSSF